jgi:TonB family protein
MKTSASRACLLALACVLAHSAPAADSPKAALANVPWKVHQTATANYPAWLMHAGISRGEARVRLSVSATGQLVDALVIACSHRGFGDEALRTVKRWRFEAGRADGAPIGCVGDITFEFHVNGPVAVAKLAPNITDEANGRLDPLARLAYHAEPFKNLDRIPTPTRVVAPIYPQAWIDRGITGRATVEFFIDENGHARIPLATASDHGLLGASAVAAVAQWRFEPPTCQGKPVLVRAEQVFTFQPERK